MTCLFLTRDQKDNDDLISFVRAKGYEGKIFSLPLVSYNFFDIPIPLLKSDIGIVTSVRSAQWVCENIEKFTGQNFFVVGERSQEWLQNKDFSVLKTFTTVSDLTKFIIHNYKDHQTYCYFRGQDVRSDIVCDLEKHQIKCESFVVYRAQYKTPLIENKNRNFLGLKDIVVTLYSELAARAFLSFLEKNNLTQVRMRTHIVSLSETALSSINKDEWKSINVCAVPTRRSMYDMLNKTLKDLNEV